MTFILMFGLTLAPTMDILLLLRFIEGSFTIMAFSLLMTSVLDIVKHTHYGRSMGILGAGMVLGNAISLKERKLESRPASLKDALLLLKEEKRIFIPYALSFVERFTVGFFVGVFPLMLAMKYNMGPGEIGMYMAAFLIPFAFLQYPLGAISDKIGRTKPLIVGSILYGIAVSSVGYVEPQMLAFVMVIGGIVGALVYSPSAALAGDFAHPLRRGTAMGGFNMFGSPGFAVGPFIGGLIADMYGFQVSFAVAGAAVLVIAIIFLPFLLKIKKNYAGRIIHRKDYLGYSFVQLPLFLKFL